MVTDKERAEQYLQSIIDRWNSRDKEIEILAKNIDFEGTLRLGSEDRRKNIMVLEAEFAAVRKERDAEWEAKDLYTHEDMDCACENGRLQERAKWSVDAGRTINFLDRIIRCEIGGNERDMIAAELRDALNALIEEIKL